MRSVTTPSRILEWIGRTCKPARASVVDLRYERLEPPGLFEIPEVDIRLDHRDPEHWYHRGMAWDYALSTEGCAKVLDLGSGTGWPALFVQKHVKSVTAVDASPRCLECLKQNARTVRTRKVEAHLMSAEELQFSAGSFDGVLVVNALAEIGKPARVLDEIHRVLVPGGVLRISLAQTPSAEPVREAVMVSATSAEAFAVDYVVFWSQRLEERHYVIDVVPVGEGSRRRLAMWAKRCASDRYPHRDPRLERGLATTVKSIRPVEVVRCRWCSIRHLDAPRTVRLLGKAGFSDVRVILGGGLAAREMASELLRVGRIEAGAALMDHLCRASARTGLITSVSWGTEIIARKPIARRGRSR